VHHVNVVRERYLLKDFSVDIKNETDFVRTEIRNAIAASDPVEIQMTIKI
jgi:hypothetical protein